VPGTWIDFKAVKDAVSMEMALALYGVQLRRVSSDYLRGRCPLPTHQSRRSNLSFVVNREKNAWACQSDSCIAARSGRIGGNVLDFVAWMENCTIRQAALKLSGAFAVQVGASPPRRVDHGRMLWLHTEWANAQPATGNRPLPFSLQPIDTSHPYLAERGITADVARDFGVGYFAGRGCMSGRIVIPLHNEHGDLIAYAGRALGLAQPRYKFPPRFRKSLAVFNLHRAACAGRTTAVVVEGFFDCIKVYQAGYPCVVALMGATVSPEQERLLEAYFQDVVLMLDGDDVGRAATVRVAKRFSSGLAVRIVEVPVGRQPDQLSTDEIQSLLRDAMVDDRPLSIPDD
jgi:DNA primase